MRDHLILQRLHQGQGQFQVGSYQVGTLKGGLYRPHIAPLPLYEP